MFMVEFAMGANSSGSKSNVGRESKKVCIRLDLPPDTNDLKNVSMEEDFALMDSDVITKMVDGVPSITFSNRVHEYIERRMTRTIIVKLLGSRIAFNALLSRASLLWNPKYSIQMIDLENYFFLV
ncbi:hypothetical protein ES288_D06G216700v1 [Gossypium darwinii]|uniref:Uncharacterized protein n=2 Tax=Gossypium TaxID=3633 RepID=A0A5D2KM45_GOSTO|nr:hypothetical protein ES288_D06G216700v1 [Gossypium darwinii]TYH67900.1 hypothetical protein ES332_D06G220800v1 [Gossypium tomentosum]